MLNNIYIKNIVLVDELSIDCHTQLSVVTGETGAGKSIWVDAIAFALGQRAQTSLIRQGQDQCQVILTFDLTHHHSTQQWLKDHDLHSEDQECLLQRSLNNEGRSKATINGRPCPLHLMRELGQQLLLIHSQHQHHALLKKEHQRQHLDHFAELTASVQKVQALYQQWQSINNDILALKKDSPNKEQELEWLRYQKEELEHTQLQSGEWKTLSQTHQQLHNAKTLMKHLHEAQHITAIDEHMSAEKRVQDALHHINELDALDPSIKAIKDLLQSAAIHLQEANNEMQHYQQQLDLSPENLERIESRLSTLHDLARKHHTEPEGLMDVMQSLIEKISRLEQLDDRLNTLQSTLNDIEKHYHQQANKLSQARQKAAAILEEKITQRIQSLAMPHAQFTIQCVKQANTITPYGQDHIEFFIRTNKGEAQHPLSDIVSGVSSRALV